MSDLLATAELRLSTHAASIGFAGSPAEAEAIIFLHVENYSLKEATTHSDKEAFWSRVRRRVHDPAVCV
jgi:hypothetical protein